MEVNDYRKLSLDSGSVLELGRTKSAIRLSENKHKDTALVNYLPSRVQRRMTLKKQSFQ